MWHVANVANVANRDFGVGKVTGWMSRTVRMTAAKGWGDEEGRRGPRRGWRGLRAPPGSGR